MLATLYTPVKPEQKPFTPLATGGHTPSSLNILVVDDEADCVMILDLILRRCGFNVISAPSGEEAIETLNHYAVDMVISDIMMPGIDGIALLQYIKSHPQYNHIPVIMQTGAPASDMRKATDLGAFAVLQKPFGSKDVQDIIARAVETIDKKHRVAA